MLKAKKSLGQNFLMEFSTAQRMVDALELRTNDLVLEIGPGLGSLTDVLIEKAVRADVIINAVEIDDRFIPVLQNRFSSNKNFNLINANILEWLPEFVPGRNFKVIGSIPYYITSPILHEIVRSKSDIPIAVLMVQKEVAKKVAAAAPDASYLSVFTGTFFTTTVLETIPREFFKPIPKVDSAVLRLKKIDKPQVLYEHLSAYEDFLHMGFSKPRKMLNKVFSREILAEAEISHDLRPQHLRIDQWLRLFELYKRT